MHLLCLMGVFFVCNWINTMGVASGAGTAYPSGAPELTPVFSGVSVTRSLVLNVCFVNRCLSFCTLKIELYFVRQNGQRTYKYLALRRDNLL
jgi:hypothetical protein